MNAARNLDPRLSSKVIPSLRKGMLLIMPDAGKADHRSLRFQYNPETISRSRQGEWSTDRIRSGEKFFSKQDKSLLDGHRGGGLLAKSETISLKLTFDATEMMLAGTPSSGQGSTFSNVLPELAFLEQIALGGDGAMKQKKRRQQGSSTTASTAGTETSVEGPPAPTDHASSGGVAPTADHETAPNELLLVLGARVFPVVLTSLTINEQRFNPTLEPTRAECDCNFRVLETQEVKNNKPAEMAFTHLLEKRTAAAEKAQGSSDDQLVRDVIDSIRGSKKD